MIDNDLLPPPGGACEVGPAPPSRRWAAAMMYWTGPFEDDAPARYYVSPPDESWDEEAKHEWLAVFSATMGPAVTVHEVTPGHFAHGRMLRQLVRGDVRRSLFSEAFVEGWAHYAGELMVDQGFRADDPRFAIGVYLDALVGVTGLASGLGIHQGTMTVDDATARFEADAFLLGPAARSEATRATYDPTYGRYTWGKLEIMSLRDEALAAWGTKFSLRRFHEALLALGAPPLGTMSDTLVASPFPRAGRRGSDGLRAWPFPRPLLAIAWSRHQAATQSGVLAAVLLDPGHDVTHDTRAHLAGYALADELGSTS